MGALVMLLIFMAGPMFLLLWNQQRTAGKLLCNFLTEDNGYVAKLLPVWQEFVLDGDVAYYIFPDRVRITRYPAGWPKFIQQPVPTALYEVGDAEPLDWHALGTRTVSAVEIGAALEPEWLRNFVRGAKEHGKEDKAGRMMLFVCAGGIVICMLAIFYMITRMGGIEQAIKVIKP